MKKLLGILFLFVSSMAFSASTCPTGSETIFYCKAVGLKKHVSVCDLGSKVTYSYGKVNAQRPELHLVRYRNEVTTYQWHGVGRTMYYHVNFKNAGLDYTVYYEYDKFLNEEMSGVRVYNGDSPVASVLCDNSTVIENIQGVDLPIEN